MVMNNGNELERELAELRNRYDRLRDDKVRTEQNLVNVKAQLQGLESQAVEEFGTSDPEELQKMIEEKQAENARVVEEYRKHISSVEEGLLNLEKGVVR